MSHDNNRPQSSGGGDNLAEMLKHLQSVQNVTPEMVHITSLLVLDNVSKRNEGMPLQLSVNLGNSSISMSSAAPPPATPSSWPLTPLTANLAPPAFSETLQVVPFKPPRRARKYYSRSTLEPTDENGRESSTLPLQQTDPAIVEEPQKQTQQAKTVTETSQQEPQKQQNKTKTSTTITLAKRTPTERNDPQKQTQNEKTAKKHSQSSSTRATEQQKLVAAEKKVKTRVDHQTVDKAKRVEAFRLLTDEIERKKRLAAKRKADKDEAEKLSKTRRLAELAERDLQRRQEAEKKKNDAGKKVAEKKEDRKIEAGKESGAERKEEKKSEKKNIEAGAGKESGAERKEEKTAEKKKIEAGKGAGAEKKEQKKSEPRKEPGERSELASNKGRWSKIMRAMQKIKKEENEEEYISQDPSADERIVLSYFYEGTGFASSSLYGFEDLIELAGEKLVAAPKPETRYQPSTVKGLYKSAQERNNQHNNRVFQSFCAGFHGFLTRNGIPVEWKGSQGPPGMKRLTMKQVNAGFQFMAKPTDLNPLKGLDGLFVNLKRYKRALKVFSVACVLLKVRVPSKVKGEADGFRYEIWYENSHHIIGEDMVGIQLVTDMFRYTHEPFFAMAAKLLEMSSNAFTDDGYYGNPDSVLDCRYNCRIIGAAPQFENIRDSILNTLRIRDLVPNEDYIFELAMQCLLANFHVKVTFDPLNEGGVREWGIVSRETGDLFFTFEQLPFTVQHRIKAANKETFQSIPNFRAELEKKVKKMRIASYNYINSNARINIHPHRNVYKISDERAWLVKRENDRIECVPYGVYCDEVLPEEFLCKTCNDDGNYEIFSADEMIDHLDDTHGFTLLSSPGLAELLMAITYGETSEAADFIK